MLNKDTKAAGQNDRLLFQLKERAGWRKILYNVYMAV